MEEDIRNFVAEHLVKDSGALKGVDDPIFSSGVVDSFGMVELLSYLYVQYQVEIDPATVEIEDLDTPVRIAQLVRARRGET